MIRELERSFERKVWEEGASLLITFVQWRTTKGPPTLVCVVVREYDHGVEAKTVDHLGFGLELTRVMNDPEYREVREDLPPAGVGPSVPEPL